MLAIIGGSGLTRLSTLSVAHREVVRTPYGEPSSALLFGQIAGRDVVFLARHGHGHTIPPHRVNYRANLWTLKNRGASAILAVASVGAIREAAPGDLVLPHQLIDYTHDRESTFFDGGDQHVVHVDFTHPYAPALREKCLSASRTAAIALADGGIYGAVSGPRLETAAEIDRMERDGATLVGMTGMPEAALARELALPYAAIAVVVNHAAGRGDSSQQVSMEGIAKVLEGAMVKVRALLDHVTPWSERRPAMIREVLRMGDPRLLQRSLPVDAFGTPELEELLQDLRDTMAARSGAGLAAPQIGVLRQVVIFGVESNDRYPDAEPVPYTELVNPVLTPLSDAIDEDWEGCLSVPGLRGVVPRYAHLRYEGFDPARPPDPARSHRVPRARRPARMRSSAGHPVSDADARSVPVRLHRNHLPGQRARRRIAPRGTNGAGRGATARTASFRGAAAHARRAAARRRSGRHPPRARPAC